MSPGDESVTPGAGVGRVAVRCTGAGVPPATTGVNPVPAIVSPEAQTGSTAG